MVVDSSSSVAFRSRSFWSARYNFIRSTCSGVRAGMGVTGGMAAGTGAGVG